LVLDFIDSSKSFFSSDIACTSFLSSFWTNSFLIFFDSSRSFFSSDIACTNFLPSSCTNSCSNFFGVLSSKKLESTIFWSKAKFFI